MKFKKLIAGLSAALILVGTVPFSAFAAGDVVEDKDAVEEIAHKLIFGAYTTNYSYTVENSTDVPEKPALSKFDLRDVDGKCYIPSVRDQTIYGTCWAFAATAAAEGSLAYEAGYDYNTLPKDKEIDLSERHLAWFSSMPQPADGFYPSQAGEGIHRYAAELEMEKDDPDYSIINESIYNGGLAVYATTLYSSLQGPCLESLAPYPTNDKYICEVFYIDVIKDPAESDPFNIFEIVDMTSIKVYKCSSYEEFLEAINKEESLGQLSTSANTGWFKGIGRYWFSEFDNVEINAIDWSLDESLRYVGQQLEHSAMLPQICVHDAENNEYSFSETGLNAVKNELISGRPVTVSFHADTSLSNQGINTKGFINFIDEDGQPAKSIKDAKYWCHYTYDTTYDPNDENSVNKCVGTNHAVCIVGYDDYFPKEYFKDPKGTIGGDGAFIVRNSWGSKDTYSSWGNEGDGYFYLSYYDQSLKRLESFDFDFVTVKEASEKKMKLISAYMYDLMPSGDLRRWELENSAMSNIYHAETDCRLFATGFINATCNESVKYDIYLLNDGYKSPTDGTLLATKTEKYKYAGYHRVNLDEPLYIREGQSYSVVATVTCENGANEVCFKAGENINTVEAEIERSRQAYIKQNGTDEGFVPTDVEYWKGVINKGESFICVSDQWYDWSDVTTAVQNSGYEELKLIDFDNFTLQAFTEVEAVNVKNFIDEPSDKPYKAGDKVNCTVALNISNALGYKFDVYINGELIGSTDPDDLSETVEFPYVYTVTEEDEERGYFETVASVFTTQQGVYREVELFDEFSDIVAKADAAAEKEDDSQPDESQPDESQTDESDPEDSSVSTPDESAPGSNPATGFGPAPIAFIAIALAGAVVTARRRR